MTEKTVHLPKSPRSKNRSFAILKMVGGLPIRAGLVAIVLLLSAYLVETKAILSLESSQNLFEVIR